MVNKLFKEVHTLTPMKRSELDNTIRLIKLGKSKKELRELLGIKASNLSNRLRRLEDLGEIELFGKYGIKYIGSSHKHPKVTRNIINKKLNKRGHAFNFKVYFPKETINLNQKDKVILEHSDKRINKLEFGSYQLKYKKYTIWINKKSLTIYSNNSYYATDALHSKFRQLKEINNLVAYLKQRYELRGLFGIELFREHYGLIFNKFAEWCNKNGYKLSLKNKGNKEILWIDNSRKDDIGLNEFESDSPTRINKADRYFQDQEKTSWEVTPTFVLNAINKVTQNQLMFNNNFESHVEAIRTLSSTVKELERQVLSLRNENKTI